MAALYTLALTLPERGNLLELVAPGLAIGISATLLYALLRFLKFLLIYLGVALPAVWSRNSQRRKDALAVLKVLLPLLNRGPRGP
ncbi:hypothetical protein ABZZ74_47750 [Streptomyces sp. NPDC006476]|uniref:hypothetical protein n=1 Tax=Streptomyces sp. NPDC006476 TaxID=3157175 RepID=UPI0033B91871